MSVEIQVTGYLGKDPYVQTIGSKETLVLSIASRRVASRHADWITGSIWDKQLQAFVLASFKKGDKVLCFGLMSGLGVYYSEGKWKPSLDMFVNAIVKIPKAEVRT